MEVNARIIKEVLVNMLESGDLNLNVEWHRYCVAIQVASAGIEIFVPAWNDHPIPGIAREVANLNTVSDCP